MDMASLCRRSRLRTRKGGPGSIQCDPFGIRDVELLIYPGLGPRGCCCTDLVALSPLSRPMWVIDPGHYETPKGQIPIL